MNLTGVEEVARDDLAQHVDKHCVEDLSIISYTKVFAWHVSNPVKLDPPVPVLHKKGTRVWMVLEFPQNASRVREARARAETAQNDDQLEAAHGQVFCIAKLSQFKKPYFRLRLANVDFVRKFYYVAENFESMRAALLRTLDAALPLMEHQDRVDCMQLPELKTELVLRELSKTGSLEVLRSRFMGYLVAEMSKPHPTKECEEIADVPAIDAGESTNQVAHHGGAGVGGDGEDLGNHEDKKAEAAKNNGMSCSFFDAWLCFGVLYYCTVCVL